MGQARMPGVPQVMSSQIPGMHPAMPSMEQQQQVMYDAIEKAKRAAELQKKIQEQLASKPNLVS